MTDDVKNLADDIRKAAQSMIRAIRCGTNLDIIVSRQSFEHALNALANAARENQ